MIVVARRASTLGRARRRRCASPGGSPPTRAGADAGGLGLIRLASLLEWLVLARRRARAARAAAARAARRRRRSWRSRWLLVALDLFKAGMGYNPAIPSATPCSRPRRRSATSRASARTASPGSTPRRRSRWRCRCRPNVAMRYGLYDARGYDFPIEERYAELWRRVIAQSPDCNYAFCPESAGRSPRALRALGLLGVTDLLQNRARPAAARASRLAYDGAGRPRLPQPERAAAGVPGRPPGGRRRRATRRARRSPPPASRRATAAVTERAASPGSPRARPRGSPGSAPHRATTRTSAWSCDDRRRAPRRCWCSPTAGSRAGRPRSTARDVPIERVDYLIRGVPVPAGQRTGSSSATSPPAGAPGWIVSLLALLAILAAAWIGWRRRMRELA